MNTNNITIFVADDDPDDKLLIQDALEENGIGPEAIILTSDGEELLLALRKHTKPCIVFLDLNMPRKDGRQTLREIKCDDNLKHIPVIVFTTSAAIEDIITSYQCGSNTYFKKPTSYSKIVEIFQTVKSYWFQHAMLT